MKWMVLKATILHCTAILGRGQAALMRWNSCMDHAPCARSITWPVDLSPVFPVIAYGHMSSFFSLGISEAALQIAITGRAIEPASGACLIHFSFIFIHFIMLFPARCSHMKQRRDLVHHSFHPSITACTLYMFVCTQITSVLHNRKPSALSS